MNKSRISTNGCKRIVMYFAELCVLQHTDQTQTINKLIVSSNTRLRENNNMMIEKGCETNNIIVSKILEQYTQNINKNILMNKK